jgi:SAM-dependent methyltransferase/uncharacterized protein YbaR (Trm112 family)
MIPVDPYVQEWVAGTNGRLYLPLVGKLTRYPIPRWPGPRAGAGQKPLLLDIGTGWGRWTVAAGQAGYTPVGIDLKLEGLLATQRVMRQHDIRGYVVGADLKALPFRGGVFDFAYSYSVIQHVHRRRAASCLEDIVRVLRPGGQCMLEFPLRTGVVNYFRYGRRPRPEEDDYESWCVRYYSIGELKSAFSRMFGEVSARVDCFFGIGVKVEDIDLLPLKYKPIAAVSELLRHASGLLPLLTSIADSVYMMGAAPRGASEATAAAAELGDDNLSIAPLLRCPICGAGVTADRSRSVLRCDNEPIAFPIIEGVPMMIADSAIPVSD